LSDFLGFCPLPLFLFSSLEASFGAVFGFTRQRFHHGICVYRFLLLFMVVEVRNKIFEYKLLLCSVGSPNSF
jgi:hypothetical protein